MVGRGEVLEAELLLFRVPCRRDELIIAGGGAGLTDVRTAGDRLADARMVAEFMALANRSDSLRKEVVNYIQESRRMQVDALNKAMPAAEAEGHLPSVALAIFATSAALTLHRESGIGLRVGHDQVLQAISRFIDQCEGTLPAREVGRVAGRSKKRVTRRGAAPRPKRRLAKSRS